MLITTCTCFGLCGHQHVFIRKLVLALIGLVWLYHDGEISTSVMFAIEGGTGGGICDVRYPGVYRTIYIA